MYGINNIIVARPSLKIKTLSISDSISEITDKHLFIYPSFPRFFKNFEVVCEACKILESKNILDFKVLITLDGSENKYSKQIVRKYKNLKTVKFIGLLSREDLFDKYKEASAMIFSSKLETWGLPISEFKATNKPLIVSDLPYAYETVGQYSKVTYFNPNNSIELASIIEKEINGINQYTINRNIIPDSPHAENWEELLDMIKI